MELPARIGKYELEEFLGGGMSHVYRARDTVIGRTVAVKILTEAGCADEDVRARFLAEARMAGNLAHDHILSIYDFGEDDLKRPFMVMEFLRGEDLRSMIRNSRTGDTATKLKIAIQVAKALQYTHSQKIVHRDIKPENIHINKAGVAKLIDFGIAKTEGLQMTRAGYVLGTPFYMAPEQVMGSNITEQVDVYSFGILLFELFTGVKPIQAETVERIFYFILNEPLNLDPLHAAGTPQSICDLIQHCTAKKPGDRPHGFAPIVAELERAAAAKDEATLVLEVPPPKPLPAPVPAPAATAPAARPAWLLPAILVVIAGLGTGIYFATRPKPAAPAPVTANAAPSGMVLVPAGEFLFGKDKQPVTLPAYLIDRTEVSNADYARFTNRAPEGDPALPVVNITFQDAAAYASWAGKRLPTAQEWEKAARGADGRLYPWGDEPDAARANVKSDGPQPVDAFPNFASPFRTLQMLGNVWEFMQDRAAPEADEVQFFADKLRPSPTRDEPWHPIRGGSFKEGRLLNVTNAQAVPERWKSYNIGFRCARDAK